MVAPYDRDSCMVDGTCALSGAISVGARWICSAASDGLCGSFVVLG